MYSEIEFTSLDTLLSFSGEKVIIRKRSGEFHKGIIGGFFLENSNQANSPVLAIWLTPPFLNLKPGAVSLGNLEGTKLSTRDIIKIEVML